MKYTFARYQLFKNNRDWTQSFSYMLNISRVYSIPSTVIIRLSFLYVCEEELCAEYAKTKQMMNVESLT